jgi:transposase
MEASQFYNLLLELTDEWQVKDVSTDYKVNEVYITIDYICKDAESPIDFERYSIYDYGPSRKCRHLDTMNYKTYIVCRLPRVKDKSGKVSTIKTPWASKHERHTYLFEESVIDLLQVSKNQTKTASFMNCTFRVVNRIMHISVERGLLRRDTSQVNFHHISIDEKSFRKGHSYVSVLSHPTSGTIIDVAEGRTKKSVRKLLDNSLTEYQQQNVRTISLDMWKAYITVSKEKLPKAELVHDRFHLVSYLNNAIDKVRKREVKTNEELKNSRYALLKNQVNLTEKQRIKFEAIKLANYEVSKAWQVKENFKDLFNIETNKVNAIMLFIRWVQTSIHKQIKEVTKVVEMFDNHFSGVVNALVSTFNNAMAERLNGKIQEIKTIGRGYRTFKNFRSAILFFNGGLSLYPLK